MMSQGWNGSKRKASSDDKCYNCRKFGHFGQDCRLPDQQKKQRSDEPTKQQPARNRAHIAAATAEDNDSDIEFFRPGVANMMKESNMQAPRDVWYLDSCASHHLTDNKDLFIEELRPKCLNFTTAGGQILRAERIGAIAIPLADGSLIKLRDVAYSHIFSHLMPLWPHR